MENPFYFSRPATSYALGPPGDAACRIIGPHGPVLGHEVWMLGHSAYGFLREGLEKDPTDQELAELMENYQPFLDQAFEIVLSGLTTDEIKPAGGQGQLTRSEAWWRTGTWLGQVRTLAEFMKARGAFAHSAIQEFFSAPMLVACLLAIEEAVLFEMNGEHEAVSACILDAAWLLAQVKTMSLDEDSAAARMAELERERASARAKLRHARSPKRAARDFVHECWIRWRAQPGSYPSVAAFARAMLEKKPDELTSDAVVARWVRAWNRETSL